MWVCHQVLGTKSNYDHGCRIGAFAQAERGSGGGVYCTRTQYCSVTSDRHPSPVTKKRNLIPNPNIVRSLYTETRTKVDPPVHFLVFAPGLGLWAPAPDQAPER